MGYLVTVKITCFTNDYVNYVDYTIFVLFFFILKISGECSYSAIQRIHDQGPRNKSLDPWTVVPGFLNLGN